MADIATPTIAQLDQLAALFVRAERTDLVDRLRTARGRLDELTCTVLVVGEFKKGKSTLVNAVVNAPVSPVDDDIPTARPVEVFFADPPCAELVFPPASSSDDVTRVPIAVEEVARCVLDPSAAPGHGAIGVRVGIKRQLLDTGLVLVDTPGVGGLGSAHSAATVGALPSADAVVFVTDSSQELTASEIEFLRTVTALCPKVVCVTTKTDFYPAWRKVLELDRAHLARAGLEFPVLPVSSVLRTVAIERNDRSMNEESGYADVISHFRDEIVRPHRAEAERRLLAEAATLLADLDHQLSSELRVLQDPEQAATMMRQLEAASERATRMQGTSARWRQKLDDGQRELTSEVNHDLRLRFRETIREADAAIDRLDPAKHWDQFELWLCQRVTTDVINNFKLVHHRSWLVASKVAGLFDADEAETVPEIFLSDPTTSVFGTARRPELHLDHQSMITRAVSALRGASGGMIMFTSFATLMGGSGRDGDLKLIAATFGSALAGKMLKDESARQVTIRRATAKRAVQQYVQDMQVIAAKEANDTMFRIHVQLRDHFVGRANELNAAAKETLSRTRQAIESSKQARVARHNEVNVLVSDSSGLRTALGMSVPSAG
jgi:signal recognition particle receptor subunit beta